MVGELEQSGSFRAMSFRFRNWRSIEAYDVD